MKYYICARPCHHFKGRHVYPWSIISGVKPTINSFLDKYWIVLTEQEREIYRDYMVKEGYNYEDC